MLLYICKKQIFEWFIAKDMERIKNIYITQPVFIIFNDFDSSGGRVMQFTASGQRSLLIEVRGRCKYMH